MPLAVAFIVMTTLLHVAIYAEEYKEGYSVFDPKSRIIFFAKGIEGTREKKISVNTFMFDEEGETSVPIPFNKLKEDIREVIRKLVTYNRNKGFTVKEVIMLLPSSQTSIPPLQDMDIKEI